MSIFWIIMILFWGHWYLSLFTQTFFYHRYSAHKMFTMSRFWEKVFYVMSWAFQGSSFLSPYAYGIMHRMHHAFPDTEKDVHSPKFSKNLFDMMWKTKKIYNDILYEKVPIDERWKGDLPYWKFIERLGDTWANRIFWGTIYVLSYVYFISIAGDSSLWYLYLLLPIHFVMGPFHGVVINWFAHIYGYVNFKVNDTSKNFLPVDFLMWGESYHNNHHKKGNSPNFGVRWWELDPAYVFIRIFDFVGIIKLNKSVIAKDKNIIHDRKMEKMKAKEKKLAA